jgi:hypothetical protein
LISHNLVAFARESAAIARACACSCECHRESEIDATYSFSIKCAEDHTAAPSALGAEPAPVLSITQAVVATLVLVIAPGYGTFVHPQTREAAP